MRHKEYPPPPRIQQHRNWFEIVPKALCNTFIDILDIQYEHSNRQ